MTNEKELTYEAPSMVKHDPVKAVQGSGSSGYYKCYTYYYYGKYCCYNYNSNCYYYYY